MKKRILFLILACLPFFAYYIVIQVLHVGSGQNNAASILPDHHGGAPVNGVEVEKLHGFIVWSSNRFGNHELLKMTLPDKQIVRLTTNPLADTFPRISPDGKRLVFTRAQKLNVSQRDYLLWDVYLLDLLTGEEKLLAKNGYQPSWSEKGDAVYFQYNGFTVGKYELATGHVSVVFESGKSVKVPQDTSLGQPSWSDMNKAMAVTFRDGMRATGIIQANGDVVRLGGDSCELAWSLDGSWLYYVDHDWKRNNVFYRIDLQTKQGVLLFDSPTEYSHEYFPKLDNTGKYLVFGASTGGHEHDQADYEIFLWRIGSPPDAAVRLTFDPANDCWPDMYVTPNKGI
jgi:Tol biopolymer transport system component